MSISVNNVSNVNLNTQLSQSSKVAFKASSVQTLPNDTIEISTKKKGMSKETKWGIGLGIVTLATLVGIFCHKKLPIYKINKKFADLEKKLPEVQQTFKDVFLNDNLSIEQTKEILQKYKDLEKMRIDKKVSIQDYGKAVFEVAAKNYGLEHANIKLVFDPIKNSKSSALWRVNDNTVVAKDSLKKESVFSLIHHELRHAKQTQAIFENLPKEDVISYYRRKCYNLTKEWLKEKGLPEQSFEEYSKSWTPDFTECMMEMFGSKLPRKEIMPTENGIKYAKKMKLAEEHYVNLDTNEELYWTNDLEIDARRAETLINKLFKLNKLTTFYYKQKDAKYYVT